MTTQKQSSQKQAGAKTTKKASSKKGATKGTPKASAAAATSSDKDIKARFKSTVLEAQKPTKESQAASSATVDHEAVKHRAEQIWLREGQPQGRDEEIWLQAEKELKDLMA